MLGESEEETALVRAMSERAQAFLSSFAWCESIEEFYFGDGIGNIFAAFFARIKPSRPSVDEYLWVVVGDVPPAYLVTDHCHTPKEAICAYIEEMRKWVAAARLGQNPRDVIPVNAPATPESAEALNRRLDTLEYEILPKWFVD